MRTVLFFVCVYRMMSAILNVFIDRFSLFVVVVERTMSWLVEQDGARIFLPLSNVCQGWNEKQSAKLTRTIAVLCFRFLFVCLFVLFLVLLSATSARG